MQKFELKWIEPYLSGVLAEVTVGAEALEPEEAIILSHLRKGKKLVQLGWNRSQKERLTNLDKVGF